MRSIQKNSFFRTIVALALLGTGASAGLSSGASVTSAAFSASADAYVSADSPGSNSGAAAKLRVDGSPSVVSYVRFRLDSVAGAVVNATLSLHAASDLPTGVDVHSTEPRPRVRR